MRIVRVDPRNPEADIIAEAAAVIRGGGLVAFPTETVYGLGANALDGSAVERIYEAKGRPAYNPVIVHVLDANDAARVVRSWPASASRLAAEHWPGPLTMVLPRQPALPDRVTAGLDTAAVRAPAHPVARALIAAAGVPVAAPSANRSTAISPTTAEHVAKSLDGRIDLLLDGGPTAVGIESTVIDLSRDPPSILRPGTIDANDIARLLGTLTQPAMRSEGEEPRRAPGMLDRHYAPATPLFLSDDPLTEARRLSAAGRRVVVLGWSAETGGGPRVVRVGGDATEYARNLYATLHALDAQGLDAIVVERVPDDVSWDGVRDRLNRAAAS